MKLNVKAARLPHKDFKEAVDVARLWPTYQRDIARKLLAHIQYLNETVLKLEEELHGLKQTMFLEEKAKFEIKSTEPQSSVSKSLINKINKVYTSRGERYYTCLVENKHEPLLRLQPELNINEMLDIANEWAILYSKPLIIMEGPNDKPFFSNRSSTLTYESP